MFSGLTQGSYLLTLHSRDYFFPPFRVDVEPAEGGNGEDLVQIWQTFRGNEWSNKGPRYGAGVGYATAEIRPSAKKEFYQARGGFSLISFVKSPMILMALFSVVMIFGMPYLMDNSMSTLARHSCTSCAVDAFADLTQWTQRPRRSLTKCRQRVRSQAAEEQHRKYKISILPASWLENQAVRTLPVAVRRNNGLHHAGSLVQIAFQNRFRRAPMCRLPQVGAIR